MLVELSEARRACGLPEDGGVLPYSVGRGVFRVRSDARLLAMDALYEVPTESLEGLSLSGREAAVRRVLREAERVVGLVVQQDAETQA